MEIFIDTSAFAALIDQDDQYHKKAESFVLGLDERQTFHTTNYIIDETITRLRKTAGYKTALQFGKMIFSSKVHRIHYIDQELEHASFEIFKKFSDKDLSFTDCTSFALMKKLGIKKAFAFDEDFVVPGFEIVPTYGK